MNTDLRVLVDDIKARFNPLYDLVCDLSDSSCELSAKELCGKVLDTYVCLSEGNMLPPVPKQLEMIDTPTQPLKADTVVHSTGIMKPTGMSTSVGQSRTCVVANVTWYPLVQVGDSYELDIEGFDMSGYNYAKFVVRTCRNTSGEVTHEISLQPKSDVTGLSSPLLLNTKYAFWSASSLGNCTFYTGKVVPASFFSSLSIPLRCVLTHVSTPTSAINKPAYTIVLKRAVK